MSLHFAIIVLNYDCYYVIISKNHRYNATKIQPSQSKIIQKKNLGKTITHLAMYYHAIKKLL